MTTRTYEADALEKISEAHPGRPALDMCETAAMIGYTYMSFRSIYGQGGIDIPSYRAGRRRMFAVHDIARYLAHKRKQGQAELKEIKRRGAARRKDQLARLKGLGAENEPETYDIMGAP